MPELIALFKENGVGRSSSLTCTVSPALPFVELDPEKTHSTEIQKVNGNIVYKGIVHAAQAALEADIPVGLGTDSPAATESTDMLSEMRLGMLLQRAVNPGRFLDSHTMLEVATLGGARALGIADKVGSLEIGKCADMIAVDLSSSHQSFTTDPVAAVVNTCTTADVLMTMVDGNVLYEKNRWHVKVEAAKSIARVIEIRSKLRPEA